MHTVSLRTRRTWSNMYPHIPALVGGISILILFPSSITSLLKHIFVSSLAMDSALSLIPILRLITSTETTSSRYFNSYRSKNKCRVSLEQVKFSHNVNHAPGLSHCKCSGGMLAYSSWKHLCIKSMQAVILHVHI